MSKGPYPYPQKSSGLHSHPATLHRPCTVHSHRTWDEFHGHDKLPAGAGDPVEETEEQLHEVTAQLPSGRTVTIQTCCERDTVSRLRELGNRIFLAQPDDLPRTCAVHAYETEG